LSRLFKPPRALAHPSVLGLQSPFPWGKAAPGGEYSRPPSGGPPQGGGPSARGPKRGKMRVMPLAADDPMTLWSAAGGDAAAL
jgi:hypothetical protein